MKLSRDCVCELRVCNQIPSGLRGNKGKSINRTARSGAHQKVEIYCAGRKTGAISFGGCGENWYRNGFLRRAAKRDEKKKKKKIPIPTKIRFPAVNSLLTSNVGQQFSMRFSVRDSPRKVEKIAISHDGFTALHNNSTIHYAVGSQKAV